MLLVQHDGGGHHRGGHTTESRRGLEWRVIDGRVLKAVVLEEVTRDFRVEVAHVDSQDRSSAALGQLGMDVLEVIGLGAARRAPLSPRVEHDDLIRKVIQGNCLALVAEIFTGERLQRLALIRRVRDFLLTARGKELESTAGSYGILRVIGILTAARKSGRCNEYSCRHGEECVFQSSALNRLCR